MSIIISFILIGFLSIFLSNNIYVGARDWEARQRKAAEEAKKAKEEAQRKAKKLQKQKAEAEAKLQKVFELEAQQEAARRTQQEGKFTTLPDYSTEAQRLRTEAETQLASVISKSKAIQKEYEQKLSSLESGGKYTRVTVSNIIEGMAMLYREAHPQAYGYSPGKAASGIATGVGDVKVEGKAVPTVKEATTPTYVYKPETETKQYVMGEKEIPKGAIPISKELYETKKPLKVVEKKKEIPVVREVKPTGEKGEWVVPKTARGKIEIKEPTPTTKQEFAESLFRKMGKEVKVTPRGAIITEEARRKVVITSTGYVVKVPKDAEVYSKFVPQVAKKIKEAEKEKYLKGQEYLQGEYDTRTIGKTNIYGISLFDTAYGKIIPKEKESKVKGYFKGFFLIPKQLGKGFVESFKYTAKPIKTPQESIALIKKPSVQTFLLGTGLVLAPTLVSYPISTGLVGYQVVETIRKPTPEKLGVLTFMGATAAVGAIVRAKPTIKTKVKSAIELKTAKVTKTKQYALRGVGGEKEAAIGRLESMAKSSKSLLRRVAAKKALKEISTKTEPKIITEYRLTPLGKKIVSPITKTYPIIKTQALKVKLGTQYVGRQVGVIARIPAQKVIDITGAVKRGAITPTASFLKTAKLKTGLEAQYVGRQVGVIARIPAQKVIDITGAVKRGAITPTASFLKTAKLKTGLETRYYGYQTKLTSKLGLYKISPIEKIKIIKYPKVFTQFKPQPIPPPPPTPSPPSKPLIYMGKPPAKQPIVQITAGKGRIIGEVTPKERTTVLRKQLEVIVGKEPAKVEVIGVKTGIPSPKIKDVSTISAYTVTTKIGGVVRTTYLGGLGVEKAGKEIKGFEIVGRGKEKPFTLTEYKGKVMLEERPYVSAEESFKDIWYATETKLFEPKKPKAQKPEIIRSLDILKEIRKEEIPRGEIIRGITSEVDIKKAKIRWREPTGIEIIKVPKGEGVIKTRTPIIPKTRTILKKRKEKLRLLRVTELPEIQLKKIISEQFAGIKKETKVPTIYRAEGITRFTKGMEAKYPLVSLEVEYIRGVMPRTILIRKPISIIPEIVSQVPIGKIKPILKPELKPTLKPELKPILKPELKPTLKPELKPILKPELKPTLKPELKPALKPVLKSALKPILKPVLKPTLKPSFFPFITPKPRIIPSLLLPFEREKSLFPAFKIEVKRFGKYQQLGKEILPRGRALRKGAEYARRTLGATFRIIPTKEFTSMADIAFRPSPEIFRTYKIKKGKKIFLTDEYIQFAHKRLSMAGEVREIQEAKQKATIGWFKSKKKSKWRF